jgi:glucokinase
MFSAFSGASSVVAPRQRFVDTGDLDACLTGIRDGFAAMQDAAGMSADAISFAFPGPANYSEGVIFPLANIPAFDRPVALGPMLEDAFGVPVYINNDGDLFALGEARAGLLREINAQLEQRGSDRRYRNLVGLTLGTGLGCGVYTDGRLLRGDNDAAAEIWSIADHLRPGAPVEESVSIRGLRRRYAEQAGIRFDDAPQPREIYTLLQEGTHREREAASHAFEHYYTSVTEVIRTCIALFDGIVVLGGGIAGSAAHFLPAIEENLNAAFPLSGGGSIHRLESTVYNLSDPERRQAFLQADGGELTVPGSGRSVLYTMEKRSGLAVTTADTSETIMKGAYYYAADRLRARA